MLEPRECCGTTPDCHHLDGCDQKPPPDPRLVRPPVGTVAVVEGKVAVLVGRNNGPSRWQWMNGDWTSMPMDVPQILTHVDDIAAHPAPEAPEATVVEEWNVLDHGEPYLQPWTDEWDARSYSNEATGPLVRRTRTKYADHVSPWVEVETTTATTTEGDPS